MQLELTVEDALRPKELLAQSQQAANHRGLQSSQCDFIGQSGSFADLPLERVC